MKSLAALLPFAALSCLPAFAADLSVRIDSARQATVLLGNTAEATLKCGLENVSDQGPVVITCPKGINGASSFAVSMDFDASQAQFGSEAGAPGSLVLKNAKPVLMGCSAALDIGRPGPVMPEFPFLCTLE
jgi:hypothetical protein